MLIKRSEIARVSSNIREIIDGKNIDIRDNKEGAWCTLKNDIHTLAILKREQTVALQQERDSLADTLADISHQLKTPLTSMIIMADLLENAPSDRQGEFIANIKTELTHMDWLVSALLKMAKLDAGAITFLPQNVIAKDLISMALEPLQILLEVKNQKVIVTDDEMELFCDKRWTAEALTNVIKNASEYSPMESVIRVTTGKNPISSWISVTDSGKGIPLHDMSKIFSRYKGTRSDKGYGIGLPLSRAIVKSQNGDIEVGTGDKGGAIFILKFFK